MASKVKTEPTERYMRTRTRQQRGSDPDHEDEVVAEEPQPNPAEEDEDEVNMMSNSNSLDETYNNDDDGEYDDEDGGEGMQSGLLPAVRLRMNKFWRPEIDTIFLDLIKAHCCLYDHRDVNWKNKQHKEVIWELIGSKVGTAAAECRRHFKHMRDKFVRNKRMGKSQDTKFTKAMSFLVDLDLIKHRPKPDEVQFLGTMSPHTSPNNGSSSLQKKFPRIDPQKTYLPISQSVQKRSFWDVEEKEEEYDCDEDGDIMAYAEIDSDPILTPAVSIVKEPRTSTTYARRNQIQSVPTILRTQGSSNLISTGNPLSNVSAQILIPNGFTVPGTINQTTITPTFTNPFKSNPSPPSTLTTNGCSTNGTGSKGGGGPNYFFGQYVASVLDSLPQAESLLTRHKLQEILYEAQSRLSSPQTQLIDFKCANCCKIYQGSAQLP